VRRRWYGSTGVQVPEIVVEGEDEISLEDALVLDDVKDTEQLREAHQRGIPVVVRAAGAEAVAEALARPEVASVLVPAEKRDLRELDLRELKYGA
jgi:hypothetical protein